jgi:acetylornithine deacetylase
MDHCTSCRKGWIVEDRILSKIAEKETELVELLRTLVRIPSLTGEEGEAQDFLAGQLRDLGMDIRAWEPDIEEIFRRFPEQAQYPTHWRHDLILPYDRLASYDRLIETGKIEVLNYRKRPNLVGTLKGKEGGRSLLFNGHIDNVTVEPRHEWTHDPFGAEIVDGKMYGRGASDMKGGMAASLGAIQCLVEAGVELDGDVIYSSVVNEEHSGNGMLSLICKGIRADAAIVNEPSENQIYIAAPGDVYWQVTIEGNPCSPGARWEGRDLVGVSAIDKVPLIIESLLKLEADCNALIPDPLYGSKNAFSCVVGEISGGTYATVTAKDCIVRGCMYFGHGLGSVNDIMDRIKGYIARAGESDPWLKEHPSKVEFLHHRDSCRSDDGHELLGIIHEAATSVHGKKPSIIGSPYCADMGHVVNLAKIPTIIYGPGSIAHAHKADEFISIREYLASIRTLALTIYRWCR